MRSRTDLQLSCGTMECRRSPLAIGLSANMHFNLWPSYNYNGSSICSWNFFNVTPVSVEASAKYCERKNLAKESSLPI